MAIMPAFNQPTPAQAHRIISNGNLVETLNLRGVGFASQFHFFEELFKSNTYPPKYPPYNIRAINKDYYIIEIALAGFPKESLFVTLQDKILTVKGEGINTTLSDSEFDYVHQGIARRDFKHDFPLADHIEVKTATFEDGMLTIELVRNIPEELKPKTIKIK
jgi:molecular chaperone IbpA